MAKNTILGKFLHLGDSGGDFLLPVRAKFGVLEQSHGIRIRAKFCLDRFILSACGGETPKFCRFCGVASWQQSENVEHGCTSYNHEPFPNAIKIVSVLQRIYDEIGRTIYDILKHGGQTNRQTNQESHTNQRLA